MSKTQTKDNEQGHLALNFCLKMMFQRSFAIFRWLSIAKNDPFYFRFVAFIFM
jgi:hypothetical protein